MKIIFTGGGSGGHIYPIVAIIRELRKNYGARVKISYMGPGDNFCNVTLEDAAAPAEIGSVFEFYAK